MDFRAVGPDERLVPAGEMSATLEPLPGYSDEEVVSTLRGLGASSVSVLAPGYITAKAISSVLTKAREIADVHIKPKAQIRVG